MAQILIDREHPLQDTLIWVTLPCLRCCREKLPEFIPNQTEGEEDDSSGDEAVKLDPFAMTESLKDLVTKKANASVVGVKESQMEKYAQATNEAVAQHGD